MLNIALVWCVAGAAIWQGYRDAVTDGQRTAVDWSLATAAYTQQALLAANLSLKSILDWVADKGIQSEAQFAEVMRQRRVHDALRDRIVTLPQVGIASVFDREGYLLGSSFEWPAPTTRIGQRGSFQARVDPDGPPLSVSNALVDPNTQRWTFYLLRKIMTPADRLLGVAIVGIDSDYFAALFGSISLGEDSSISLFKLDGALLATTVKTPDLMGKTFDTAAPVGMIRDGQSGSVRFIHEPPWWKPSDSGSRIAASRQVEGLPLLVAVTIGERTLLGPWRQRLYFIVALASLVSAIAGLVTVHLLRLRAQTESAAHLASERRVLTALVDTPPAACAVLDQQGRVLLCNDRFREVVAVGRKPDDVLRDGAVRGGAAIVAYAASSDDHPLEVDLEIAWPDGTLRHLHFSAFHQSFPEVDHCTILVGHDETLRHQAQQAAARTAKLVTLGEMTSGMAHELSQPLNVIKMAAQNALSEVVPSEQVEARESVTAASVEAELRPFIASKLNRIIAQVDRAASIIARMREFGRTPDGPPATFDVRDACRESQALVKQRLRSAGIAVREYLGDAPLLVFSHRNQLEQVLINLLLNARDALLESTRADKTITLTAYRHAGRVNLTVSDNGPGVPPEIRERIFEPPTGQGMGLGLSHSFGIVREAGGTLSLVASNEGATFHINLPEAHQGMP